MGSKALLIVDLQQDFLPGGALAVPNGDAIIPVVNALLDTPFDFVVASKDWHPAGHGSFADSHGKQVGERISLQGIDQILWPVHCVEESCGADFPPSFQKERVEAVVLKGRSPFVDSYSAFYDNCRKESTGLTEMLREKNITALYVVGLATDYCVKATVLDAIGEGFTTYLIKEGCRGVNLQPEDTHLALLEMQKAGAIIL